MLSKCHKHKQLKELKNIIIRITIIKVTKMLATNDFMYISNFLTDREKIYLATTSSFMHKLRYKFRYCEKIRMDKIVHLPYFHNFEFVKIHSVPPTYPKNIKFIHLLSDTSNIPPNITHLTFRRRFNEPVKNIPSSVTHLKFGDYFDQSIEGIVSRSVTHLKLRWEFSHSIKSVPDSVTHLTLYCRFDRLTMGDIPQSVTHLKIGGRWNQCIKNSIPQSVTHLSIGYCFMRSIENDIPDSITHLYFYDECGEPLHSLPPFIEEITLSEEHLVADSSILDGIKIKRYRRHIYKYGFRKFYTRKIYLS